LSTRIFHHRQATRQLDKVPTTFNSHTTNNKLGTKPANDCLKFKQPIQNPKKRQSQIGKGCKIPCKKSTSILLKCWKC